MHVSTRYPPPHLDRAAYSVSVTRDIGSAVCVTTPEPTELHTERLLLRPFRLEDVDDVLAYRNGEEYSRYLFPGVPYPYSRSDAEGYIARRLLASWDSDATFAIVLHGTAVGGIDLRVDASNRVADIGYSIARQHWGKGLMTEAVSAVIDFAFETLELAKVSASANLLNVGSWRVLEKLGMRREGVLHSQAVARDGTRMDEVHYGFLREEWEARA